MTWISNASNERPVLDQIYPKIKKKFLYYGDELNKFVFTECTFKHCF